MPFHFIHSAMLFTSISIEAKMCFPIQRDCENISQIALEIESRFCYTNMQTVNFVILGSILFISSEIHLKDGWKKSNIRKITHFNNVFMTCYIFLVLMAFMLIAHSFQWPCEVLFLILVLLHIFVCMSMVNLQK